jgi:prophage DNA circulation protein
MATIRDVHKNRAYGRPTKWRDDLLPAHFDGFLFHVDTASRESGRRIVEHEFPKKDLPYAEDMGQHAVSFTVRGYCITYPVDTDSPLYQRDYRIARDALQTRLDQGGPGNLQLPTMEPMLVVCQRYRLTEESKLGGFCIFDMQFTEYGVPPFKETPQTQEQLKTYSQNLAKEVKRVLESLPQQKRISTQSPPAWGPGS